MRRSLRMHEYIPLYTPLSTLNIANFGAIMISDQVIQEIYKTNTKPPKHLEDLHLVEALDMLQEHHNISIDDSDLSKAEVILNDLEVTNHFRRFLVRSLFAILEFDKMMAFVFRNHILFLGKKNSDLRVHFKPEPDDDEEGSSFFSRLFGRRR